MTVHLCCGCAAKIPNDGSILLVCLMPTVVLILYFYTALILQYMFMILLFVQLRCFAMLIHYCHIVVKSGPRVPSLVLFLTCVLFCGVCVFVSAGCLCSRAKTRERRDWYASPTSFSPRHLSALSSPSFFSPHIPLSQSAHTSCSRRTNQNALIHTQYVTNN